MKSINFNKHLNRVLHGMAIAIVVGLIPNAILGELFKFLASFHPVFKIVHECILGIQFTVPLLVGALIATQYKFHALQAATVSAAAFIGSGIIKMDGKTATLEGVGDIINATLTAGIAVFVIHLIGNKLGSLTMILMPTFVATGVGLIGLMTLPFVKLITSAIGNVVNSLTSLQPVIMCMLVAIIFGILIASPISSVAIAMAIGISGHAAGAASLGITACSWMLAIGAIRVNKIGIPIALILGGMKMMMPNMIKHPIIMLPIALSAALTGMMGSFIGIEGNKETAGFGFMGLVGPVNAMKYMDGSMMMNLLTIGFTYFVFPGVISYLVHLILCHVLKVYPNKIFRYELEDED
ncbi:PTS transporter subunit IIC [Staphylococcus massiliensis]|uniref:Regulatory protein n=1 Tax=Staphylococcus massiliensis S46 TaxID=1229783 RepID=K9AHM2_9STAP|nr:PTS sugar transporter subunit IIC [Staphylococcus massiliensis]EKU46808.1 regulatory protein [Staphylococcus massiliensis S46]MCG3399278.1 PTS sugar transporter subunit IIC [Staphylococcus massiliensis]POA01368.1 PTS transporter subunit IIC [Staphylococcus massiliensis CCUG 55927]